MSNLNAILDGLPRAVVLEAMYLASHELTCSTRMSDPSVAQNKALNADEVEEATRLAREISAWFEALEGKPIAQFGDADRLRLARKLSGYRRHNLTKFSDANRAAARELLVRLSTPSAATAAI